MRLNTSVNVFLTNTTQYYFVVRAHSLCLRTYKQRSVFSSEIFFCPWQRWFFSIKLEKLLLSLMHKLWYNLKVFMVLDLLRWCFEEKIVAFQTTTTAAAWVCNEATTNWGNVCFLLPLSLSTSLFCFLRKKVLARFALIWAVSRERFLFSYL